MIEHATTALLGAILLGLITNQITRILLDGSLFDPLRDLLIERVARTENRFLFWVHDGFRCHLCFGQEIGFLVTWAALAVGYAVDPSRLPWQEWLFLAAVGPFAVGAVDQLIEMARRDNV